MIFIIFQYPIKDNLAKLLLVLEWVISFLFLELSLIFLHRVVKHKKELKSLQEKGYFWLFLGFSLMWLFFILGDHYVDSPSFRIVYLNCGYISIMITTLIFIFIIESYKNFLKKYLFTIIFTSNIILYLFILIFNIDYTQFISFTFWPIFVIFFIFYSRGLSSVFKLNPVLGEFRFNYLKLVFGILFLISGFGLTTDYIITHFGLIFRIIGDIMQMIAYLLLLLFFISIPTFSEYEWKKKIESIYIMHKSGLLIYEKSFIKDDDSLYESYKSGIITSLKIMLERINEKEAISIIEKKGKYIIIHPGEYIYCALICVEKLKSIQILLSNLIEEIETIYSKVLENWDGNLNVFSPIEKIVDDNFL